VSICDYDNEPSNSVTAPGYFEELSAVRISRILLLAINVFS
jgi:hypothetical protein